MGKGTRVHEVVWNTWFPNHKRSGMYVHSPPVITYNCIAFAAGEDFRLWWPNSAPVAYWPIPDVPDEKVERLVEAFERLGYERCWTGIRRRGFEKVAIYQDENGNMTHAARQGPSGEWESKLGYDVGVCHDVRHAHPKCLCGPTATGGYGTLYCYMRRKRKS